MSWEYENTDFRCGNCYEIVDVDGSMSSIKICNSSGIETDEIQVIDAICYIYGISLEEIRTWTEQLKGPNSDLNDVHWLKGNSIHLCEFCSHALSDNYNAHKKFEELSNGSSIVCQINKFRRGEWESMPVPIIKAEVDMVVENQGDGDADSFCALNSDSEELNDANDAQVSDSACEIKYNPVVVAVENQGDGEADSFYALNSYSEELHDGTGAQVSDSASASETEYITSNRNEIKKPSKRTLKKKGKSKAATSVVKSLRSRQVSVKVEQLSDEDLEEASNLSSEETEERLSERRKRLAFKTAGSSKRKVPKIKEKKISECEFCGKKFERKGKLRVHRRNHFRKEIKENCHICGKNVRKDTLTRHIKDMHSTEEEKLKRKIPCELCGVLLVEKSLKDHMKTKHIGDEKFNCEKCEKTFSRKSSYNAHMVRHSEGFTPFLCGQCGKQFNCKYNLAIHEKIHKAKEFTCDICSRQFLLKSYLKTHLRDFHVTEKKYVCEECGRSYKNKRHLVMHQRLHREMAEKGENPVQCDECGKNFKHSVTLARHKIRNHREDLKKVHQCDLCNKILSDATCLRTHKKLVHKMFLNESVSKPIPNNNSPEISQTQSESTTEMTLELQQ